MLSELSIQGVRDRMLLLRSLPAFAPLEDHALTLLAEHMRVRTCKAGEVLLMLGEPVRNAYVVLEGDISWARKGTLTTTAQRMDVVGVIVEACGRHIGRTAVPAKTRRARRTPRPGSPAATARARGQRPG